MREPADRRPPRESFRLGEKILIRDRGLSPKRFVRRAHGCRRLNDPSTAARPVVLVVDDDQDTADSLREVVAASLRGADVVATTSPREATRFVAKNRVDVVVVDYVMPYQNGVEFLEAVRAMKPDLPAVLITGLPSTEVLTEAVNRGHVQGLFVKPLALERFLATLERLLRKRAEPVERVTSRFVIGL